MPAYTIPSIFTAIDRFSGPVRKMESSLGAFIDKSNRGFKSVGKASDSMFNKLTGGKAEYAIAGGLGLAGLAINKFVSEASKIEDAEAYFTPILGGVDKARKLVEMLNKTAADTPYQFEAISDVASTLLPVMNGDLDKTVKTFRMLGDTAGGNVQKLDSITRGFTKAMLKGKVDMEALNMIAEAGVPIFPELAKSMGYTEKTMDSFFKEISKGTVKTDKLVGVFEKMTSEGGMFFKGMETASQTFTGVTSTMLDNINLTAGSIGMALLPTIKEYQQEVIKVSEKVKLWVGENQGLIKQKFDSFMSKVATAARWLADNFETIVTIVKWYIATLVTLKAISIATTVATYGIAAATFAYNVVLGVMGALTGRAAISIGANTVALGAYKVALAIVTAAQWLWNGAMSVGLGPMLLIAAAIGTLIYLAVRFYKNWDMIVSAFKTGGILEGIKAIGAVLLDSILLPLQKILEAAGKIPGMGWASTAAKSIQEFRSDLIEPVNPVKERSEMIEEKRQNVSIDINDKTGSAKVKSDNNFVPIKTTSTFAF